MKALALDPLSLPAGGVLTGGVAGLDYSHSGELHVNQASDRAVIDWDSFNIGERALTEFHQPSASAIAVNRVTGARLDPTQILGTLRANGRVVVLDRNGVIFGAHSLVDVGGIVASTGRIDDGAFLRGDTSLKITGADEGQIVLDGQVSVADAGLAAFVAPQVVNSGVIVARAGSVALAGATAATLDLYGDGLTEIAVDADAQKTLVSNTGLIAARGGSVALTAAAARKIVDATINMSGIVTVGSATQAGGKIILAAEGRNAAAGNRAASKNIKTGESRTLVGGLLDASGYGPGQAGGAITVTGDEVALLPGSRLDASGDAGGGDIRIGGDYSGGGATPASLLNYVDPGALILNDAVTSGDGGRTIVWSDGDTGFYGTILARGGADDGDGGFAETSGHQSLDAKGFVDLTAPHGNKGTYLLDPADIAVYGHVDPAFASSDGGIDLAPALRLWLDGSDAGSLYSDIAGTTPVTDGQAVAFWHDKSGNGNDAVQSNAANRPHWIQNGQNGNGVLTFDGVSDWLNLVNASTLPSASTGATYFTTASTTSLAGTGYSFILDYGTNSPAQAVFIGYGFGTNNFGVSQYGGAVTSLDPATDGVARQYSVTASGGNWYIYQNGAYRNAAALGSNTVSSGQGQIGLDIGGASYFHGALPELISYDAVLPGTVRALVEQYQSAKWNVALDPNSSTALPEATEAMNASTGYSAFTTRYLERLSQGADIVLQASNDITLDLQGDTLDLSGNRTLTLNAGHDIVSDSAGRVKTNAAGSIDLTAGHDIALTHDLDLEATGNGDIALAAAHDVTLSNGASLLTHGAGVAKTMVGGVTVYDSSLLPATPPVSAPVSSTLADAIETVTHSASSWIAPVPSAVSFAYPFAPPLTIVYSNADPGGSPSSGEKSETSVDR